MHKGYTLNYFINFFKNIPANKWTTGRLTNDNGQACALGHAYNSLEGRHAEERGDALCSFLGETVGINENTGGRYRSLGRTPKKRILKALRNRKRYGSVLGNN